MSIDWDKPVQTHDGREVRIYTTDGENKDCPIVGEVKLSAGRWSVNRWTSTGADPEARTALRLVNHRQQHTVWVNLNRLFDGSVVVTRSYQSRAEADDASVNRVACIEVTFTEGEGL